MYFMCSELNNVLCGVLFVFLVGRGKRLNRLQSVGCCREDGMWKQEVVVTFTTNEWTNESPGEEKDGMPQQCALFAWGVWSFGLAGYTERKKKLNLSQNLLLKIIQYNNVLNQKHQSSTFLPTFFQLCLFWLSWDCLENRSIKKKKHLVVVFFCIRRSMEMRCEDVPADEDAVVHYYLREEVQ